MPPAVQVDEVTKVFQPSGRSGARRGPVAAVGPLDLQIAAGQVVTLLGPSGCGKTTLLRLIGGLDVPTSGRITVNGRAPQAAAQDKEIGWVPQAPALAPWRTVAGNARLLHDVNRRASRTDAPDPDELLDEVGLSDARDAYPHELSGGMQQRVALVRALTLGPALLLLDEPFAALDELSRADARHLLARLCERYSTTVVFVTHSIAEAVYVSDRIVVLSPRPAATVGIEPVELPRPRMPELEDDEAFFALEKRVRAHLRRPVVADELGGTRAGGAGAPIR